MGFGDFFKAQREQVMAALKAKLRTEATSIHQVWAHVADNNEGYPRLVAEQVASLRENPVRPDDWVPQGGNSLEGRKSVGIACGCGGCKITVEELRRCPVMPAPTCGKGKATCSTKYPCRKHGWREDDWEYRPIEVEVPCTTCDGTGFYNAPTWMCEHEMPIRGDQPFPYWVTGRKVPSCRDMALFDKKLWMSPNIPISEDTMSDGLYYWTFAKRYNELVYRRPQHEWAEPLEWIKAIEILKMYNWKYINRLEFGGRKGTEETLFYLPGLKSEVAWVFQRYHANQGLQEGTQWWKEFVSPKMGYPHKSIEPVRITPVYGETYKSLPMGDLTLWEHCLATMNDSLVLDPDDDLFFECENFEDCLDISVGAGIPAALETVGLPHSPLKKIMASRELIIKKLGIELPNILEEDCWKHPGKQLLQKYRAKQRINNAKHLAFVRTWVEAVDKIRPKYSYGIAKADDGPPDQESKEDQQDLKENASGGEMVSTPQLVEILQKVRKDVRGKEFKGGAEGRYSLMPNVVLDKHDVFVAKTLMEKLKGNGIVRAFRGGVDLLTSKVGVDYTNIGTAVRFPEERNVHMVGEKRQILSGQTYTVLERPSYECINKIAEKGYRAARTVVMNMNIQSLIPQHTPVYALCCIMWGHTHDPVTGTLCGSYVYLGGNTCSVLQLPLVCSFIGQSLNDYEAYKRSLLLCTTFFGPDAFSPGQTMFMITNIEFTEYLPSACAISHEKESWQDMLSHVNQDPQKRFIAGFNVVDAMEKERPKVSPEVMAFPEVRVQAIPRITPVVRTFDGNGSFSRSQTMPRNTFKIKSVSDALGTGTGFKVPVNRIGNPIYEKGESSSNTAHCLDEDDVPNACASDTHKENFLFTSKAKLDAAISQGTVIHTIDILESIRTTGTAHLVRWMNQGYIDMDIKIVIHLPVNRYTGLAIFSIIDAFDKFPGDLKKKIDVNIARCLPTYLSVLSRPETMSFVLDMDKICGHTLFVGADGFSTPILRMIAATTTTLAMSSDAIFRVEGYAVGEKKEKGFTRDKVLTYPFDFSVLEKLDFFLPPVQINIGSDNGIGFPLDMATVDRSDSGHFCYSFPSAILSHFMGIGGILHGSIVTVSSVFVSCKYRVCMWHEAPTHTKAAMINHVDSDDSGDFNLEILDPFYTSSVFGDSGAQLCILPLSSPIAPSSIETNFEFIINIKGFTPHAQLCKTLNFTQRFAWFGMRNTQYKEEELNVYLPNRIVDIAWGKGEIKMYRNAFRLMCGTTGLHHGAVNIHFSWLYNRKVALGALHGNIQFTVGFGNKSTSFHGETKTYNALDTSAVVPLVLGTLAGPTPAKAISWKNNNNWIRIYSSNWQWLDHLYVSVEVLPGFKFYGRSAGPFKKGGDGNSDKELPPTPPMSALDTESSSASETPKSLGLSAQELKERLDEALLKGTIQKSSSSRSTRPPTPK